MDGVHVGACVHSCMLLVKNSSMHVSSWTFPFHCCVLLVCRATRICSPLEHMPLSLSFIVVYWLYSTVGELGTCAVSLADTGNVI